MYLKLLHLLKKFSQIGLFNSKKKKLIYYINVKRVIVAWLKFCKIILSPDIPYRMYKLKRK